MVYWLALLFCLDGSHPCLWAHSPEPIASASIEACMKKGQVEVTAWNRSKRKDNWVAVGMMCDDRRPQEAASDM